jgi:DNA-binding transcriptional regulator YdaS (Cro superfamily)
MRYIYLRMDDVNTPEKAALRRAAERLGGQAALASALGFANRTAVWPWFNTARRVPAEYCPTIERLTRERAKCPEEVVTCEELRPDVQWSVLREQAAPQPEPAAAQG